MSKSHDYSSHARELNNREFQQRLADKRTDRGDLNRAYRYARRAMFKQRNKPRELIALATTMQGLKDRGRAMGLRVSGVQQYEELRDGVLTDMARDLEEASAADKILNDQAGIPLPQPTPLQPLQEQDEDRQEAHSADSYLNHRALMGY